MKKYLLFLMFVFLFPLASQSLADDLMMARTQMSFPEAMLKLQGSIRDHGYTVSRVQRVDIGLSKSGYSTDKYRIVFFGKAKMIRRLSNEYPQLIPYLPFKIAIFAEAEETLIVAANPHQLIDGDYPELKSMMKKIENDMQDIFRSMREHD